MYFYYFFFFSSRRRHTRCGRDWSSDVCSSDLHQMANFSIYPNPATDILNIQTNEEIKQVVVYNIQGRKLIQEATSVLNITTLSSGMYLLELHTANGTATIKFVKK